MPTIRTSLTTLVLLGAVAVLTACGLDGARQPLQPSTKSSLPATVQAACWPAHRHGNRGAGDITLRMPRQKDMPSAFEWQVCGPRMRS